MFSPFQGIKSNQLALCNLLKMFSHSSNNLADGALATIEENRHFDKSARVRSTVKKDEKPFLSIDLRPVRTPKDKGNTKCSGKSRYVTSIKPKVSIERRSGHTMVSTISACTSIQTWDSVVAIATNIRRDVPRCAANATECVSSSQTLEYQRLCEQACQSSAAIHVLSCQPRWNQILPDRLNYADVAMRSLSRAMLAPVSSTTAARLPRFDFDHVAIGLHSLGSGFDSLLCNTSDST